MKNNLINFDLVNWALDCHSESITAFTEFLRKDLEEQIEKVENITNEHNKILDEIKDNIKSDYWVKEYFNNRGENILNIKDESLKIFFIKDENKKRILDIINKKRFGYIYYNMISIFTEKDFNLINFNNINEKNTLPKENIEFIIKKKEKIDYVIKWNNRSFTLYLQYQSGFLGIFDETNRYGYDIKVWENFDYERDSFNILNKEIQKQIIESDEYWEYLETFVTE